MHEPARPWKYELAVFRASASVSEGVDMSILPSKPLTILHISDLHLVNRDLVEERGWRKLWTAFLNWLVMKERGWKRLWKSLCDRLAPDSIDLCVISGDLSRRSPRKKLYQALRTDLNKRLPPRGGRRRWIAVPGNHDRKFLGNFLLDTGTFEQYFDKDWKHTWWDPDYPCIVVPLDSNPSRAAPIRAGVALARGVLAEECNRMGGGFSISRSATSLPPRSALCR